MSQSKKSNNLIIRFGLGLLTGVLVGFHLGRRRVTILPPVVPNSNTLPDNGKNNAHISTPQINLPQLPQSYCQRSDLMQSDPSI